LLESHMISLNWRLLLAFWTCLPLLSQPTSRFLRLDTLDELKASNVSMDLAVYDGRKAVRLLAPNHLDRNAIGVLPVTFRDGVIELEVAGRPAPGSNENARGFIGLAFHVADERHFESFYLRPTNARADDQLRRNHSVQYAAEPDHDARQLRSESPGLYESYVDLQAGVWTKMRIVVRGRRAELYVHGSNQPCLIVHDLKLGESQGLLALWVGEGTDGYFSNLRVTSERPPQDWAGLAESAAREINFHGVILIQKGGHVAVNRAFGDPPGETNTGARYWIASISKSLTATLIFRLQEVGALDRNDAIAKFFPDAPPDKQQITIGQLLTHTSGLPNSYASEGIVNRDEAVHRILRLPLRQPSGAEFLYTNDGYSLLGAIAESAGRHTYGKLLEQEIFTRSGMKNSGLWPHCPGPLPIVPLPQILPEAMNRENWGYKGPDGVCSSVSDLLRFMNALRAGKILKPSSLQAMWTGKVALSDGEAAAGWFRSKTPSGSPVVWTRGTDHGHNSIVKYYPEHEVTMISLSSSQNPDGPLLARMLINRIEEKLGW
jgi:CubicO group peptidase (beta-lactamase class C family)